MLSEDAINNLVQPIIDRQESINTYVLKMIAQRVREIGQLLPSDVEKLDMLMKSGADVRKLNEELALQTGLQVIQIKHLVRMVAIDNYIDAKPFYDYRHKSYIPFEKNIVLQRRVEAIANTTAQTYVNMSKSTGFMIRDLANPNILKPTPLSQAYQSVVDEAIQAVSSGVIDYNTAMRRTMKQLGDSGLRYVTYSPESGRHYTQRMDTAVRRNVLEGVRAINQEMQNLVGKEFGADGVEISVHMNPAEDHAEMQGHQFTLMEFENMQSGKPFHDIQGRLYHSFDRAVGTLNCRHFAISIVIGYAKQNYSDEKLQQILDENEKGYTLPNGKHLTMYECTQMQRKLETMIRKNKDGQITARTAGNLDLAREYQVKVNKYTNEYKQFSNACGLSMKRDRTSVSGYKKISTK